MSPEVAPSALVPTTRPAAANPVPAYWDRLKDLPLGKRIFSKALGSLAPYSGTIDPRVVELRPGYAKVEMRDKRRLRNHLGSLHAAALANLAELTGNLAILYSLPDDARMIVSGFSIEYLKKARGGIAAECECPVPEAGERREYTLDIALRDAEGHLVARATSRCLVSEKR